MKKLFVLAAICAVSSIANAGWLYWQVGGDMTKVMDEADTQNKNWNYARFYKVDEASGDKTMMTTLYNAEYTEEKPFDYSTGVVEIDMAGLESGYSFYIEFVNAASATAETVNNVLGYGTETYAGLSGSVQTTRLDVGQPIPESAKWHTPQGGYNAPEPTSAMLMLLGVAGLALKRKQKKA